MTPLKQQISLIPFSIEHWYSPYKRRRFANNKDVLSVIQSANLRRRQNLKKVIRIRLRIFARINLDPDVRQNYGYTRRRHSFRQVWFKSAVDCMRTEKTEKC